MDVIVVTTDPTMLVYTKIDGLLAAFRVQTSDPEEARTIVQGAMSVRHKSPVLVLISAKNNIEISPNLVA
jgi:hypothetical protein